MSSIYDLDLDTDVIHEDSTSYQSLLDKNHIDLFSDEHMKEEQKYENRLKKKDNEVLNCLFVKQSNARNTDDKYNEILFQQPMVIDKQKSYQNNAGRSKEIVAVGTIAISVIFIMVMVRYLKKSKKVMEETYE